MKEEKRKHKSIQLDIKLSYKGQCQNTEDYK